MDSLEFEIGQIYFDEYGEYRVQNIYPASYNATILLGEIVYLTGTRTGKEFTVNLAIRRDWLKDHYQSHYQKCKRLKNDIFRLREAEDTDNINAMVQEYLEHAVSLEIHRISPPLDELEMARTKASIILEQEYQEYHQIKLQNDFVKIWQDLLVSVEKNEFGNILGLVNQLIAHEGQPQNLWNDLQRVYESLVDSIISVNQQLLFQAFSSGDLDKSLSAYKKRIFLELQQLIPTRMPDQVLAHINRIMLQNDFVKIWQNLLESVEKNGFGNILMLVDHLIAHNGQPQNIWNDLQAVYESLVDAIIKVNKQLLLKAFSSEDLNQSLSLYKKQILIELKRHIPTRMPDQILAHITNYTSSRITASIVIETRIYYTKLEHSMTFEMANAIRMDYHWHNESQIQQLIDIRVHIATTDPNNSEIPINKVRANIHKLAHEWIFLLQRASRQNYFQWQSQQLESAILKKDAKLIDDTIANLAQVMLDERIANHGTLPDPLLLIQWEEEARSEALNFARKLEHKRLQTTIPELQKRIIALSRQLRHTTNQPDRNKVDNLETMLIESRLDFCKALFLRTPEEEQQLRFHFSVQVKHEMAYGENNENRRCWLCKSTVGPSMCDECQSMGCHWWVCACGACKDPAYWDEKSKTECKEQRLRFGEIRMQYLIDLRLGERKRWRDSASTSQDTYSRDAFYEEHSAQYAEATPLWDDFPF